MIRIYLSALIGGFLNLAIEMVAGRLLAPYLGSSLYQWAAMIGVALTSYMIGYTFHRRILTSRPHIVLLITGIYAIAIPFFFSGVAEKIVMLPMGLAASIGSIILIGLPSIVWAAFLPYLQEFSLHYSSQVLAWSALGNLVGVGLVAFGLIPTIGSVKTTIFIGSMGVAMSLLWWPNKYVKTTIAGLMILAYGGYVQHESGKGASIRKDSAYQNLSIWDVNSGGTPSKAFAVDGTLQFIWNEKEKLNAGGEMNHYNFATAAVDWVEPGPAKKVLMLGLGGGLVPWQIFDHYPETQIDIVEIDPEVIALSGQHLPFGKIKNARVFESDARLHLRKHPEKYDYIFVDTYIGSYIPFHLTTQEFFGLLKDRLNEGGVIVANVLTVLNETGLMQKMIKTVSSVFGDVATAEVTSDIYTILVATKEPGKIRERLRHASAKEGDLARISGMVLLLLQKFEVDQTLALLTDDLNDTEQRMYVSRQKLGKFMADPY